MKNWRSRTLADKAYTTPMPHILRFLAILLFQISLSAQAASNEAKVFEVASVKPTTIPRVMNMIRPTPGRAGMVAKAATLEGMVKWTFGLVANEQLVWKNRPSWSQMGFDIEAKTKTDGNEGKNASQQDLEMMFQNLLEERFGLNAHAETREIHVFILTVEDPKKIAYSEDQTGRLEQEPSKWPNPARVKGHGTSIGELCDLFTNWAVSRPDLDRIPVVDKTGIQRRLDFSLTFAPNVEGMKDPAGNPTPEFEGPTLFQALREQMGLKLSDGKAPMRIIVIDSAHMPNSN